MDYTNYMRVLEKPYWCSGSPLKWQVNDIGLAHFALKGEVGKFNLGWLAMQRLTPPASVTAYQQTNLQWVILLSGGTMIEGRSLEWHASFLPLDQFHKLMRRFIKRTRPEPTDFPGNVPWKTLYNISMKEPSK